MALTPGLCFLITTTPKLVIPPLLVHRALAYVLSHVYSLQLPRVLILFIWFFTLPICLYVRACYTHFVHTREARRLGAELVPQVPGKLPGNIDLLWKNFFGKDIYIGDGWADSMEQYGTTIGNTVLGDSRVITAHPANVQQILATGFDNFEKGALFNKFTGSVLGVGVFNCDGDLWQFHRKITRPFFARERITDFGIFDANASLAIQIMQERFDHGKAIDFQDICSRFTIDSACEFLLGTSINSLRAPLPQPGEDGELLPTASNRFARAFADAQNSVSARSRIGIVWPLFEIFKDRTADDMKEVRGFIEPIVRAAMNERNGGEKSKQEDSLLQHLLNVTDDMKLIIDETINIMLAGRDTTAGLLTFITYCLAMHPHVLTRLREEIISTVGTCRAPTFDDVRGMRYLRAVINETLRLFPSVPFNSRHTKKSTILVNDEGKKLYVAPHTRIVFSMLLMQRHVPYWGPDAHLFDPDRWLDERVKKYVTPNPFIFLPFSAGPRICLGQQFAYHETSFFIIRMLQRFDRIELAPECQPESSRPPTSWRDAKTGTPRKHVEQCVLNSHLTMYAKGGVWLKMGTGKVTEGV